MGERARRVEVLVVGSANADLTVRVERRPGAGETVPGSELSERPGGKGANQAAAAARVGGRTALLARVGGDGLGRMLRDAQREAGADTSALLVDAAVRTGTALITVGPDGDNSIVVSPGANARLSPADVREARGLLAEASVVSLQWEVPPETVVEAARVAGEVGTRVVLNPSPVPSRLPSELLAAADPLVVNEHEARELAGASGGAPAEWARRLRAAGARSVVVTLGARGALVADGAADAEPVEVPGAAVAAVDTTGAGDAFTGALAVALARGAGAVEAARFAVRAGAAAVAREGAQASYAALRALRDAVPGR